MDDASLAAALARLEEEAAAVRRLIIANKRAGRQQAVALAARARQVQGGEPLEIRALMLAAWGYRCTAEYVRAEQLLVAASRRARLCSVTDVLPGIVLARAMISAEHGRHSVAMETLVSLLSDKASVERLSDHECSRAYSLLIDFTLDVDPGDSADLAIALADNRLAQRAVTLPVQHAFGRMYMQLLRHLWCHERLSGVLQARSLDRGRSQDYLRDACLQAESIDWAAARALGSTFERGSRLLAGIAAQDGRAVRLVSADMLATVRRNPDVDRAEELYLVAAGLVALCDARTAQDVVDVGAALEEQSANRRHWWMHLQSEICALRGESEQALALYKRYVSEASTLMGLQRLDARQMIEALARLSRAPDEPVSPHRPAYLRKAMETIDAAPHDASVQATAAAAGVSARTLRDAFVVHVGRPPKEYILERRLDAAHRLLTGGAARDESVADIAVACGFSHVGRFARLYRQRYGEPPSRTRQAGPIA